MVPLSQVLTKSTVWLLIEPNKTYQEVTVRLWGKGVVLRRQVPGDEIAGQRRLMVHDGQFILSRIDARNGAMGLVPRELDGAVVSNDFPVFDIASERLQPSFLGWLSKTRPFVALCQRASEGTTNRVRLKEERFLATTIDLPPLVEQRRIVARIEELTAKIEEAKDLRAHATENVGGLRRLLSEQAYASVRAAHGLTPLGEVCDSITDGDHMTPQFAEAGVKFIFVGNVSSGRLHFANCKHVAKGYYDRLGATRKPVRGDILYSAVGATLGVPAVVDCDEEFCFQRHVAIIKPDGSRLLPRFGWYMLQSQSVFEAAWAATTGSAQPTVPLRAIRSLPIPIPPIVEQRRIVAHLDALQSQVDALRQLQAETAAELETLLPAVLERAFAGEL